MVAVEAAVAAAGMTGDGALGKLSEAATAVMTAAGSSPRGSLVATRHSDVSAAPKAARGEGEATGSGGNAGVVAALKASSTLPPEPVPPAAGAAGRQALEEEAKNA